MRSRWDTIKLTIARGEDTVFALGFPYVFTRLLLPGCRRTRSANRSLDALSDLSAELWAKVFAHLKPDCTAALDMGEDEEGCSKAVSKIVKAQHRYHQLKLVCSKFKQVFDHHPDLSNQVILAEGNRPHMMPSLLVWLRHSSRCIHNFTAFCGGSTQEMALAALSPLSPKMAKVYLAGPSRAAWLGLSAFSSLVSCDLFKPATGVLSLQPLQGLVQLQKLLLQAGTFRDLAIPCHLTYLFVTQSEVTCVQDVCCPSGLLRLHVFNSTVVGMHKVGLAACMSLTAMRFVDCAITAADASDQLSIGKGLPMSIPANISTLTKLSELSMHISSTYAWKLGLDWLYGMVFIQDLALSTKGSIDLGNELTQLNSLTKLEISTEGKNSVLYGMIDWEAMQCLSHITFHGPTRLSDSTLSLTSLDSLEGVALSDFHPVDDETAMLLAKLAYCLAVHRPKVKFTLDGESVSS